MSTRRDNLIYGLPLLLATLLLALLLAACGTTPAAYIEADRNTFEAIAPEHRKYLEADESLSDTSRALRLAALDSWEMRLKAAEEAQK
jgi:hypothetical protein